VTKVALVPIQADLAESGEDLLVGTISLLSLYDFMKAYRAQTQDLDQLYEKNVRRFLGNRGRVNKAMEKTLQQTPELFGLFNNGITIVVADFQKDSNGTTELLEPYVVNGCQTTRTIWEICHRRLESGGTGSDVGLETWREKARQGIVVTKIVKVGEDGKVGADGEKLLQNITRYTNTQNAVREKDFLTLTSDFATWARQMAERYGIYLEIQRGGWDSRRALQRQKPSITQFIEAGNAFDLLKVYGAGWLGEAGTAFGRNAAFLPNGSIFRRIMSDENSNDQFGVDDLYAAYRLQKAADTYHFGRGAGRTSRRQTRFLFYMVVIELLEHVLSRANMSADRKNITKALVSLFGSDNDAAVCALLDSAIEVIDEYLTEGTEDSIFSEPAYRNTFNTNLNNYLKAEQVGKTEEVSPRFRSLLAVTKRSMARTAAGHPSPRDMILEAITE